MDPVQMLHAVKLLLVCTVIGGIVLACLRFLGKQLPSWLAMVHGVIAASALTLLSYLALVTHLQALALGGLALLLLAAAAGVTLNLGYHLRGRVLPIWLIGLHVPLAVIGTLMVLGST